MKSSLYRFGLAFACAVTIAFNGESRESVSEPKPAQEIRVITSGGLAAAFDEIVPQFESKAGVKIQTAYGSSSGGAEDSIPSRLARGETFDVLILARYSLDNLTREGYVRESAQVDLAESKIGMAIASGQPKPDISTPDKFLEVVLAADSIGYSASASGTYLSQDLFPRLKIWETIQEKSQRILSRRVASLVASGEVEIGFQQISEIISISGAQLVGPIPEEYQKTTVFSAGVTRSSTRPDLADSLLAFLSSDLSADVIKSTGLTPLVGMPK